jgi:hypothetical protein
MKSAGKYIVRFNKSIGEADFADIQFWSECAGAELNFIRPESAAPVPKTTVKLQWNEKGIFGLFTVRDHYVIARRTKDMQDVWKDSCVEFFVWPPGFGGYFNFEFNCLGVLYGSFIRNPERCETGFKDFSKFSLAHCRMVQRQALIKHPIHEEIRQPVFWNLSFFIPFSLLEIYDQPLSIRSQTGWQANFYKCADESSHPHWLSWSLVSRLNFHSPTEFGSLFFSKDQ